MANANRGLLMAGNWKMYKTRSEAQAFMAALVVPQQAGLQAMLCPSFTLLETVQGLAKRSQVKVAAQTMAAVEEGAFTGEVSALQLKELELSAVVLGHSERRQYFNETDGQLAHKVALALQYGLTPILCVGETLAERETGLTDAVVLQQLQAGLEAVDAQQLAALVVAYEPVWAIGTGKVCDAAEANRVCGVLRHAAAAALGDAAADNLRILYGGSMKPDNAQELLSHEHIDGGLIGGASLQAESYNQLLSLAQQVLAALPTAVA